MRRNPFKVGDVFHGFCQGAFGRDHYHCCQVEAKGRDWIVVREFDIHIDVSWHSVELATSEVFDLLKQHRDNPDYGYCDCDNAV